MKHSLGCQYIFENNIFNRLKLYCYKQTHVVDSRSYNTAQMVARGEYSSSC